MYIVSTKSEAEKRRCGVLAGITYAVRETRVIRYNPLNPPDSRSILGLQENGRDAERRADAHAESVAIVL